MTNAERDEILMTLLKGVNSLQITVNEIRTEMKTMATKEELKEAVSKLATKEELKEAVSKLATKEELKEAVSKLATKEELKNLKNEMINKIDESKKEIRAEVVDALKEFSQISYERYDELKKRIISNENDIKEIKLAIAN